MLSSETTTKRPTIGLFGGTFDPIHNGHLQIALDLKRGLCLDEMRLVPCHIPPHRQTPVVSASQRAQMLALALGEYPELSMDEIELHNPEPSFSVNTLSRLRQQLGDDVSLCLAMGMDSLVSFATWYRWRDILNLAHIIVAARPGWEVPKDGEIADYLQQHRGQPQQLRERSRGNIVVQELSLLPISSTAIRTKIEQHQSVEALVPAPVWQYIQQQKLYQVTAPNLKASH